DQVARRAAVVDLHAVAVVGADDVAEAARQPADGVRRRAGGDEHAVARVAAPEGAGDVGADQVALDQGAGRGALQVNAVIVVAADDVAQAREAARGGEGAATADGVVQAVHNGDALVLVGDGRVAVHAQADVVPRDEVGGRVLKGNTGGAVAGDDVAGAGQPADGVIECAAAADGVARRVVDADAVVGVAQGRRPVDVGADVIPQHRVARAGAALEGEAVPGVAGNDVPLGAGRAADGVVGRPAVDEDAVVQVGQGGSPGGVGADEVADDDVARHAVQLDAVGRVAGDDV